MANRSVTAVPTDDIPAVLVPIVERLVQDDARIELIDRVDLGGFDTAIITVCTDQVSLDLAVTVEGLPGKPLGVHDPELVSGSVTAAKAAGAVPSDAALRHACGDDPTEQAMALGRVAWALHMAHGYAILDVVKAAASADA